MLRPLRPAHQLRELEAVHLRHLHVDERERHLVDEQELERLGPGARPEDLESVAAEERLERDEVLVDVVDERET